MVPSRSGLLSQIGRTAHLGARTRFVLCLTIALATTPLSAARAVDRGPSLNWVRLPGAESCVAPVELTELVEHRLGRPVFVRARDAIVVIEGRVEPALPVGFSVILQVSDPDGTLYGSRELTLADADCRKLDEVVSLIIAVTIRHGGETGLALPDSVARELDRLFENDSSELDPSSLPEGRGGAVADRAEVQPAAAGPGIKIGSSSSAYAARSDTEWLLSTGVAFVSGLQPAFTFGPILAGRVVLAAIGGVGLTLSAGLPRDQVLSGGEAGTLSYQILSARLAVCAPSWWVGSSELAGCAAAGLGNVHVRSRSFLARNDSRDELWADVGPQLLGRARLFGFAFAQASLAAPIRLRAPEFAYTSASGRTQSAFSTARLGLQVEIAVGVRL